MMVRLPGHQLSGHNAIDVLVCDEVADVVNYQLASTCYRWLLTDITASVSHVMLSLFHSSIYIIIIIAMSVCQ